MSDDEFFADAVTIFYENKELMIDASSFLCRAGCRVLLGVWGDLCGLFRGGCCMAWQDTSTASITNEYEISMLKKQATVGDTYLG